MPFNHAALLAPISAADPCGPPLNEHVLFDHFKNLSGSSTRPDWDRQAERALTLATGSRDLRAWVWLTRTSICTEGVVGLAAGLHLIADGLEKYWDILPPQHANENDPAERFMMRLSALTQLGATHFSCRRDDLRRFGRFYTDLQTDLKTMIDAAIPGPATKTAAQLSRDAATRITEVFARGFGPGRDPLVSFETINEGLTAIEAKFDASAVEDTAPEIRSASPSAQLGPVNSRQGVVRALDSVLDYYRDHEPSSPVPLLVARAKRLVPLSFIDAIKDLAPAGLKDLQIVAGNTEDRK